MTHKRVVKLTPAEAKRFEQYVENHGGQIRAAGLLGITPATISRNVNRHTHPSPMLRDKLVQAGVIKQ